jgi:hypothetical protein
MVVVAWAVVVAVVAVATEEAVAEVKAMNIGSCCCRKHSAVTL